MTYLENGIVKKIFRGYVWVKVGKIWVLEHRLVVENFIGRLLREEEVVHHINFDKQDNRIENLMIFPNQKAHAAFHTKLNQFGETQPIRTQIKNRWLSLAN